MQVYRVVSWRKRYGLDRVDRVEPFVPHDDFEVALSAFSEEFVRRFGYPKRVGHMTLSYELREGYFWYQLEDRYSRAYRGDSARYVFGNVEKDGTFWGLFVFDPNTGRVSDNDYNREVGKLFKNEWNEERMKESILPLIF